MATDLRIGVVGATGAVGAEVVRVLDRARWRPAELVALARASTSTSHVEYGEERVPVDDVADEALDGFDGLVLAVPEEVAREVGGRAIDDGVAVVDLSGGLRDDQDVPLALPWVNPEALLEAPRRAVALPSGGALLLASVLGPLLRAGLEGAVTATLLQPASSRGRQGIDELAGQVRALFNSEPPPRRIFETGLAFDLVPLDGASTDEGTTLGEQRVAADLGRLLGTDPAAFAITSLLVPVFSGLSAHLELRPARRVDGTLVERILADGGVVVPESASDREVPRPRRVEGAPFAHVGRVRVGEDGVVRLWVTMDNLRTAAMAAVAGLGALLRVGREAG